jgi:single-strand DNA-binding protein
MRSLNKVVLMGYLAADPDIKATKTGKSVSSFSIATNRDWKTADGERHEATDFHKIIAWNALADICGKHLKKGSGVYLEGRLMNHEFKDKEGKNRFVTEIVADLVNFLSVKKVHDVDEVNLVEVPA